VCGVISVVGCKNQNSELKDNKCFVELPHIVMLVKMIFITDYYSSFIKLQNTKKCPTLVHRVKKKATVSTSECFGDGGVFSLINNLINDKLIGKMIDCFSIYQLTD